MEGFLLQQWLEGILIEGREAHYPLHRPFNPLLAEFYRDRTFNAPPGNIRNFNTSALSERLEQHFPNFTMSGINSTPAEFFLANRNSEGVTLSYTLPTTVCISPPSVMDEDIIQEAGIRRTHFIHTTEKLLHAADYDRNPVDIPIVEEIVYMDPCLQVRWTTHGSERSSR